MSRAVARRVSRRFNGIYLNQKLALLRTSPIHYV